MTTSARPPSRPVDPTSVPASALTGGYPPTIPPRDADTSALVRFVADGLSATIDSYLDGGLPLRRFAWELAARIDTLAGLDAPARTVTRLRWLQRAIENLHSELAHSELAHPGRPMDGHEQDRLTDALLGLRTVLATLTPDSPLDPAGAARPSAPAAPAIAGGGHRAATLRTVA